MFYFTVSGIDIGGGREKPRDQSDKIADKDIEEDGGDKGEKGPSFGPCDLHHKILQTLYDDL